MENEQKGYRRVWTSEEIEEFTYLMMKIEDPNITREYLELGERELEALLKKHREQSICPQCSAGQTPTKS